MADRKTLYEQLNIWTTPVLTANRIAAIVDKLKLRRAAAPPRLKAKFTARIQEAEAPGYAADRASKIQATITTIETYLGSP